MANILPVSDLRNYNEVLKNCRARDRVSKPKRDGAAKGKRRSGAFGRSARLFIRRLKKPKKEKNFKKRKSAIKRHFLPLFFF